MIIQQIRNATLKYSTAAFISSSIPGFRIREQVFQSKRSDRKRRGSNVQ